MNRKSLVNYLTGYVDALFKDLAFTYRRPSDWMRDKTRLLHELGGKGSRVGTLDLPALGKHFDKCLDRGVYTPSNLFLGGIASRRIKVPVFMRDLYLQIFDHEGKLRLDPSVEAIVAIRVLCMGLKKLRLPCPQEGISDAVKDFIDIEETIRRPTLSWTSDAILPSKLARLDFLDGLATGGDSLQLNLFEFEQSPGPERNELTILQQVCDRIASQFGDLHQETSLELPKHGPGVVSNQRKGTSKFLFTEWPTKLEATFPYDLYARTDFGLGEDREADMPGCSFGVNSEAPSRLIAVPKTMKGPRLIAAEPNYHQWIQQLVRNQLEARLSSTFLRTCIFFRSQEHNGNKAREASIDGSYATIDLSSASDRLSCWTVERAFRSNLTLLERLHAARTRYIRNDVDPYQDRYLILNKFAPQGSAVTFPVQSIVYACVAIASVLISKGERVSSRSIEVASNQVLVFGDDIIVPTTACRYTISLLEFLGLKVNTSKTFFEGNFRESCGVDAWRGNDVTPPYILNPEFVAPLNALGSQIQISNNWFVKGFWNVASWLDSLNMAHLRNKVPIVSKDSGLLGRISFCGAYSAHLKDRWNDKLHRHEKRVLTISSKVPLAPTAGSFRLFQYFIERPRPDTNWKSGTKLEAVSTMRPGWVPISDIR